MTNEKAESQWKNLQDFFYKYPDAIKVIELRYTVVENRIKINWFLQYFNKENQICCVDYSHLFMYWLEQDVLIVEKNHISVSWLNSFEKLFELVLDGIKWKLPKANIKLIKFSTADQTNVAKTIGVV